MLLLPIQIVILTIKEGFRMIIEVFGSSWGPGAFLGLQIQWLASEVSGGFDSHILPPTSNPAMICGFYFCPPSSQKSAKNGPRAAERAAGNQPRFAT